VTAIGKARDEFYEAKVDSQINRFRHKSPLNFTGKQILATGALKPFRPSSPVSNRDRFRVFQERFSFAILETARP
jgi:hypothetical protein